MLGFSGRGFTLFLYWDRARLGNLCVRVMENKESKESKYEREKAIAMKKVYDVLTGNYNSIDKKF
jgi:hypothetical protein